MGGLYRRYLLEVLRHTTVQGCVHLTYRSRHPLERALWAAFLVAGVGCTVATCLSTWNRYRTNPTAVSMTHDYTEWTLDFPASYVCPDKKVDPQLLNKTAVRLAGENATSERQQWVSDYLWALADASPRRLSGLRRFQDDRSLPQTNLLQLVLQVKHNFSHTARDMPPLRMSVTEQGVCYYDNSRVSRRGSPLQEEESGTYPSLYITAVDYLNILRTVSSMNTGYRLYLTSPDEIPNMMSAGQHARELSMLIMPVGVLPMSSTEALLSLGVQQRRCRQAHESPLAISPDYYSYGLCRMQCRIDLAVKLCGCVPYFYPRKAGQKECGIKGMLCLDDHTEEMVTLPEGVSDCRCLPRCSETFYYPLNYQILPNDKSGGAAIYQARVTHFPRLNLRKDVLFTFVDLLVSFGGAASFFMGCSLLSLVEALYYLSLRLYFYRRAALSRWPRRT